MPCNAKNTPAIQTVLKTPPNAARESQCVFSNLGTDFWQDIENDGLTMIHSISPLRGCNSPNLNTDQQNLTPKKRWKRRKLIRMDEPLPSEDGNPDKKNVSKDVIVAENSQSVTIHTSVFRRRRRSRRKSSLMQKGIPVLVSSQEDAAEVVENIDGESFASVTPVRKSKQTDEEQVFENSALNYVDPLKASVDPLTSGQKRVMTEVAATKAKRLKKNSGRKKGIESAGQSPNCHSGKTKGGNSSGNTSAPVESSTLVGVLSTEHRAEPQRTRTDLDRFETPKSSRLHQVRTLSVKTPKCKQNTPASGKYLEEAESMVQFTSENHQGVEGVGVLYQQQTPQTPTPADPSYNVTLAELLEKLSSSQRSRLSTRLAKAKIACHEEKRQQRISLKRKSRESIGELDVTPGKVSQSQDDLHTAKSQDIKLSTSLTNPHEIRNISDDSLVEKHHQTQSKVPQLEQEFDINESLVKNGSDFGSPKQERAGVGITCTLCSYSCKCPPSMTTSSPASEDIKTSGDVSKGVQTTPVVLRPDRSEHTKTSTHTSLHSQSCQTDFHKTQAQTARETTSFSSQTPPEDCSTSIPPSDQKKEPRKATKAKIKTSESLLGVRTHSKHFSKPSQLPGKNTEEILNRFFESLNKNRQTASICSQSSPEEAATLKSNCSSPVIQLEKPSTSQSKHFSKSSQLPGKETEEILKRFFELYNRVRTRSKSPPKPTPLLRRQSHRRKIKSAGSSDSTRQTDSICSQSSPEEAAALKSHCLSSVIQLEKPSTSQNRHFTKPSQLPGKETEDVLKRFNEPYNRVHVRTRSKSAPKPTPLLRRQSHRRRIKSAGSFSDSTRQTDSICSQSSSKEATTLKSHCLSPVLQLVKPPPAPGEALPKGLPLNFMKFSMQCGRRPIGKRQMRISQELFSSSGESDSDVGRARAAAQRFINMTEGHDGDDELGDRGDGEKVMASQQVRRKKYRRFLDYSDNVAVVDSADGEERSSQGVFEDDGGGDRINEHTEVEEYIASIANDETCAKQVNMNDEEDTEHTIVGTSASGDSGEVGSSNEDYGNAFILDQATESGLKDYPESDGYSDTDDLDITDGEVGSSYDIQEDCSEKLDDDEDYGNDFILDQATESGLKDYPESDGYSDTDDLDISDKGQSESLTEGDAIRDRQQRQTTDNKFYGRRLSPRKNWRRILAGLFSSSEESSSIDGQAAELAPGESNTPEGSHSCDDMPDHSKVSIGERMVATHKTQNRDVLDDTSSSGNGTDVATDQNSSIEDGQGNVLQKQISSNTFLDDDENKSEQQGKLKERVKPTGLLTVKGKMLQIFKKQAQRKMIKNTCSTKWKQTELKDFKQRDIETSHLKIASKDEQQEPTGQAAKSTDRDWTDGEVFHQDAIDKRQDESKEHTCTDDDNLDNDENVDVHVNESRDERDVLKADTEIIGGSDSDDTSLNIPDYGSSDDCPDIYDGLLKKSKSQRKKQSEKTVVKRKMLKTRKQTSDGKQTKSRKAKKDCGKTNRQQSTYEEHRKESRSNKRGGPNRNGQAADDFAKNNLVLGEGKGVGGQTNNDRTEEGRIKEIDEDIGGSDSDDTIVNFTNCEKRGVSDESSVIKQATKALQSKEVAKAGLLTGIKSVKRVKSKKSLSPRESSEYDPDNNIGLLRKTKAKKSQKLTRLFSEDGIMKIGRATNGKQTKMRNAKGDGKTDQQQLKTNKQTKEGLLKERKSPQRKNFNKSLDQTERKKDGSKNHGGLLNKSKSHQKLTQKTLPEMADMGKSKKNLVLTESMEKNPHLDNCKPIESQRQTKNKQTKSRDSKKIEDLNTKHREKRSKEHQQVARNTKKGVNPQAAKSMDTDNASGVNSNNDCDIEVADCGISEESCDNEEVQDDELDYHENEDNDDDNLILSDDENHEIMSQTSLKQSKKKTLTKKNSQKGGLNERISPNSKQIKTSYDLIKRKEDDPDKSKPLKKGKNKTQAKKTATQTESKKIKNKLATKGLKVISRKTKQVDVQCRPVEKTSQDGESTIDNTGEDVDHEGDVGIISKTHILKKSTKSKTAKPEKAVKGEIMKERISPRKSDFRKSLKTVDLTEIVAGLMNERKSTKKKNKLSKGGKSVDKEHGGTCSEKSSLTQSSKFTQLKSKEDNKEGQSKEIKSPKRTKSKKSRVWTKLMNRTSSSGKSNLINFEKSDGDSEDSDCYIQAVDLVFSGKTQDEREGDSYDDSSNDEESFGGKLIGHEDTDREGNATSDGDKYVREADDSRRNGGHCKDVGHDGNIVSGRGMKTKLQIHGDGVRSSTDEKGGDVQENWAEGGASKDDDEGFNGFYSDNSSFPLTREGSRDVSYDSRNDEAERNSINSLKTVEAVLEDAHSFSSEEDSDDQIISSGFLDEGESFARQRNACQFDHMGKSYRGKKHGCTCMIGKSPRREKTNRKATQNPVLTGSENLDLDIKNKSVNTRLRKPPTVHGLLKNKGKMLTFFKEEAARKMMENNPATDVKLEACKTRCDFGEINFNPIMYTIKSDSNRAICESLITPMPQEWEEPTISSKDREDHRSALSSIFFELLLKRGRKNRIATHRLGKVKVNRRPTIKELKKANTAEKRRLKKLEAEVKSDGWIEYDMLPAVYPELDVKDFIKEIK